MTPRQFKQILMAAVIFYVGWTLGTYHGIRVQKYRSRVEWIELLRGTVHQGSRRL